MSLKLIVGLPASQSEAVTMEFAEVSEHGIGIVLRPASARAMCRMLDDIVVAALHRAVANEGMAMRT